MPKTSHKFTLVEVVLAMGIVVVCITTIVGLFSTGMQMSNAAVDNTYKNLAIEQIGGMIETYPDMESKIPMGEPYTSAAGDAGSAKSAEDACTQAIDGDDPFFKNVFWNGSNAGTLKINFQSTVNSASVVDFTCFVKLWYTSPATTKTIPTTEPGGGKTVTIDAEELNIQMTWPAGFAYGDRVALGNTKTITKAVQQ